ncbi:MAG: transglycosylase domain-containing protein, partial [Proteobacteria bacterium]|nr:transglycosylase domain-containing protein [Pseudomonadota bacterium]
MNKKPLILITLLPIVTITIFFLIYLNTLDQKIQNLFDGARWEVPSRVYARPLELFAGKSLSQSALLAELKLLNYRKVINLNTPGEYFVGANKIIVFSRKFDYPDGSEPQQIFQVFFKQSKITKILNRNGKKFKKLLRLEPAFIGGIYPKKLEDRVLVNIDKVPDFLIDTLIAIEDRKFYSHFGVSFLSIVRAAIANIKAGSRVQGGSTLTQQLVKNFFLSNEKTFMRKINEAFMSIILEIRYEKKEIIEAYLNEVYLGQQGRLAIHGFGLASYFYFAKPLEELSKDQIAFMVGLVKGPSYYNPRRFPDRAKIRRDVVLNSLATLDMLSEQELAKYRAKPLEVQSKKTAALVLFPAFIDLVKRQLKSNYPEEVLKSEGLIIYTGLDPVLQKNTEKALAKRLKKFDKKMQSIDKHISDPLQAAIIIAENGTGEIQTIVGGRHPKTLGFNRALDAKRPIGSLVKPAVFLTALSRPEDYNLVSLLDDNKFVYQPKFGEEWIPKNYDGVYHGKIPLYSALAHSYNVATVRLGMNLGLDSVVETLNKLGVEIDTEIYPSLLLGALEITPLEVLQMYHLIS